MLARVQRLELAGAPPQSPFGSLSAWEAHCQQGMDEGYLDQRDVPVLMLAVRRWQRDLGWGSEGH